MKKPLVAIVCLFVLMACSSTEQHADEVELDQIDSIDQQEDTMNTAVRMFTLPAPLQVATTLKLVEAPYKEELLLNPNRAEQIFEQPQVAVTLGMYIIDLGYASMHEHPQTGLDMLNAIRTLSEQLNITGSFNANMIERFEANQNNIDSLSYIILEGYEQANQYFKDNENGRLGLIILTGSLVEGIYLATAHSEKADDQQFFALVAQQKAFIGNLQLLLQPFASNQAVQTIVQQLKELDSAFEGLSQVTGNAITIPNDFPAILANIHKQAGETRTALLNLK